jgi:glycosyltransferase involved in cell wall biosynthesis
VRRRLIVIGPLPPPVHGVTISTGLVLANPLLRRLFAVEHIDTSDHRTTRNTGRWDLRNIALALGGVARLLARLRGERGVVYLPLSQNTAALVRDALFIRCAAARGWKVAAHLRGGEFKDVYSRQGPPMRWLLRSALARVDSVAVLGSSLRWLFDGLVASERIAVVPNGTPELDVDGRRREAETALFLSNLRRRKGVVESLEAALLVLREHPSGRFLFVGEWEDEALEWALRSRAREAGERIKFLPPVTGADKCALLASCGFLVFPPVEPEGHPRVVLEALAFGLPVITTARGAIAETVVDGDSGFVLEDPVPEQIADRILRLLREPVLRERMGRAARARYLERFTQDVADRSIAEWLGGVASPG